VNFAPAVFETAADDPLPVGALLRERFELVEILGRGGMSTVYRARDRIRLRAGAPEAEVAVKVVRKAQMAELVHREALHLRDLLHPNIVRVFDSDRDGPHHFLVMELLQGHAVGRILRDVAERRLPLDFVLRIVGAAASALSFAHAHGIVHGDLKPSNLFITDDGDVKILDFGAAQAIGQSADASQSQFGSFTPSYASYETIIGRAPAESDDVYSLAVLAYAMLAGQHPFGGKTAQEALAEGLTPACPRRLPRARWRGLRRGLALEHHERWATMAEFARAFARPTLLDRWFG
jgi:serine/threonine protein kinase